MNWIKFLEETGAENLQDKNTGEILGSCPFKENHKRKDIHRSFSFNTEKQVYNCFVCNGGGVDKLLQKVPKNRFQFWYEQIFKCVANETELQQRAEGIPEEFFSKYHKSQVFPEMLLSPYVKDYSYLEKRGFSRNVIRKFGCLWDRKTERVIFPVRDVNENLTGIVERNTKGDARYCKSSNFSNIALFGADKLDLNSSYFIVVEGPTDVMRLYSYGYRNIVGVMTSAVSKYQARIIRLLFGSKCIILMLDNDPAGIIGLQRSKKVLADLNLFYTEYPESVKDPDKLNKEQVEEMIKNKKLLL